MQRAGRGGDRRKHNQGRKNRENTKGERAENGPVPGSRRSNGDGRWRSRWKSTRILSAGDNGRFYRCGGQRPRSAEITVLKARRALSPHGGAFLSVLMPGSHPQRLCCGISTLFKKLSRQVYCAVHVHKRLGSRLRSCTLRALLGL